MVYGLLLSLQKARTQDLGEITYIITEAYHPIQKILSRQPGALKNLEEKLNRAISEERVYIIISDSSTIIGTFSIDFIDACSVKLYHFAILPSKQNMGTGTWAIEEFKKKLRIEKPSMSKLVLEVYSKTPMTIKFYQKRGFEIYGTKEIKNELIYLLSSEISP